MNAATYGDAASHSALPLASAKAPPRFEHRIADVGRIDESRGRLGAVLVDHLGIEPSKLQPCKGCLGSQPIARIGARVLATDQCCAVVALIVWCC